MKHNPVAKFAHKANKPTVQRDRTKYQRKQKHKGDGRQDRHRPFCWARVRAAASCSASPSPSVQCSASCVCLADPGKNSLLKFQCSPKERAPKAADNHGPGKPLR